jgi:hypothetical protein
MHTVTCCCAFFAKDAQHRLGRTSWATLAPIPPSFFQHRLPTHPAQFGGGKSTGFGLIYDNVAAAKQFEPKYRLIRVRGGCTEWAKGGGRRASNSHPSEKGTSTEHSALGNSLFFCVGHMSIHGRLGSAWRLPVREPGCRQQEHRGNSSCCRLGSTQCIACA